MNQIKMIQTNIHTVDWLTHSNSNLKWKLFCSDSNLKGKLFCSDSNLKGELFCSNSNLKGGGDYFVRIRERFELERVCIV